jgi:hypothetical protein
MKHLISLSTTIFISMACIAQSRPNNFYPPTSKREMERIMPLTGKLKMKLGWYNTPLLRKIEPTDNFFLVPVNTSLPGHIKPLSFRKPLSPFSDSRN